MDILDSATLQRLQSLEFLGHGKRAQTLVFSPDSRLLTSSHTERTESLVVNWDLLTGGVAGTIRHRFPSGDLRQEYITYSTNGTMIAILRQDSQGQVILSVYDAVRHKHMHDTYLPNMGTPYGLWNHGECVVAISGTVSRAEPMIITVWEVGFTPGATITAVETFFIPENVTSSGPGRFYIPHFTIYPPSRSAPLPVTFTSREGVLVWDARNSKTLLHRQDVRTLGHVSFSLDGGYVACLTTGLRVYIWKYSPMGCVLHGKLVSGLHYFSSPLFSPNGESVITFGGFTISLWHTRNLTTPPPTVS